MSIDIRSIKPEDVETFRETLFLLSSDDVGFPEEALQHYWKSWATDAITKAALDPKSVFLGAWEGGAMVGLLMGMAPEGGVGTVVWLLVSRANQRRGIGRRLFHEACRRYREMGSHKVKLTVPSRERATFYEKQGMQVEGFHMNHWWHMDMWSMGMQL
jgi:ribosomal protein S18 acetylase RimI-like enzyme